MMESHMVSVLPTWNWNHPSHPAGICARICYLSVSLSVDNSVIQHTASVHPEFRLFHFAQWWLQTPRAVILVNGLCYTVVIVQSYLILCP